MATRYEVEWCYELPQDADGADIDNAKYATEIFRKPEDAIKRAREVYPLDCFGAVRVVEQEAELDPYITEAIGRPYHTWEDRRTLHVDDPDAEYGERDWERY